MSTSAGSTSQRHTRRCPKNPEEPGYATHKCRGPWAFHLNLGTDPITRKRRQVTGSGYRTQSEAQAALDSARTEHAVTHGRARGLNLGAWLDQWLDILRTAGRSPTTIARYEGNVRLHIKPVLGSLRLSDIEPEHLDHLLAIVSEPDYVAAGRTGARWVNAPPGLSSASINRVYDALSAALGVAVKRRMLTWNPACVVEPPPEVNKPQRAWIPTEAAAFLDSPAVATHRLYGAWHAVLVTGARRGEIAGARWHSIDLDGGYWDLTEARVQVGGAIHTKTPKSRVGTRRVYLDAGTVEVLRRHKRQQAVERLAAGPRWQTQEHEHPLTGEVCLCSGPVFTNRVGEPISPTTLTSSWAGLVRRSGQPRVVLHGGRHTSVSVATQHARVSEQTSLERHGHSSVSVQRRYQHVSEALHREAATAIADEINRHRRSVTLPSDASGL